MNDTADSKEPVEVSREELHALVWSTSMSQLAAKFGVSGNGLKKICDRLEVPYPSLGHWAKKAAGHTVPEKPLPKAAEGTPDKVKIRPTPPPTPPTTIAPELLEKIGNVRREMASAPSSDKPSKPHALVAGWKIDIDHRRKEARQRGWGAWNGPGDLTEMHERMFRILDTLFKELERRKVKISQEARYQFFAESQGEKLEIQLREKQRQTGKKISAEIRHRAIPGDYAVRDGLEGTGKLLFSIKRYSLPGHLRTEWLESDAAKMEALLPDIVGTLVAAFPLLAAETADRKEAERQRQIAEHKRYQEQERRKLEDHRWRRFVEIARQWEEAELARRFAGALRPLAADCGEAMAGDRSVHDWISWTENQIDARDPAKLGPEVVYRSVSAITTWSYRD